MLDIMKAVDEQLQIVIDGAMRDNEKELAPRYIRNADIKRYERCSHCNEHETGMRYFSFDSGRSFKYE